jgi:guanylate kinase
VTAATAIGEPGAMLVVISGPSGVGKDTILKDLRARTPIAPRHYVVTYKSRDPRPGEVDGLDYHFVGPERFAELRDQDAFLETALVYGQWSGTPADQVSGALAAGRDVVLKVDVEGARSVRRKVPQAVMVFVAPESRAALRRQLIERNTESPDQLERRLAAVDEEMAAQPEFDYVVVNHSGAADAAADEIEGIIASEHELHADRRIRL